MSTKVSLAQWRTFLAVVDEGGYAQAAEALGKGQSSVSYAVQKLETELGLALFSIEGRKAVLTKVGEQLYLRAQALIADAARIEAMAQDMGKAGRSEISIAMDALFPEWALLEVLGAFGKRYPFVRAQLWETVLGGTDEALLERKVDIAISSHVPTGFLGTPLMRVRFLPVAHPRHPLHASEQLLSWSDLQAYRQLVVRDTGLKLKREGNVWLGAEQRWTVSHIRTAIRAVAMGQGFGWYPDYLIRDELDSGELKVLPLKEDQMRFAELYLIYADAELAPELIKTLATMIVAAVKQHKLCANNGDTNSNSGEE